LGTIARANPSFLASIRRAPGRGTHAHFAGQPDLTEDHQIVRDRALPQAGRDGHRQRQIDRWLVDARAAHHAHEHVLIHHLDVGLALEHREQIARRPGVEPVANTTATNHTRRV